MAAFARGIDETSNAVQLNCFFGERFYFYNLFSCATLPVYLFICFFICQRTILSYYFLALDISSRSFSLNFARTLGRAVDKLLNGSRVNSDGQFIFGKLAFVSRQHEIQNKTEGVISHFLDNYGQNWAVLYFFFVKVSELLAMKIAS